MKRLSVPLLWSVFVPSRAYLTYFANLHALIEEVLETQHEPISTTATWIALSLANDGVVHLFGSEHSHMVAEEVFHRAGSMLPLSPMLDSNLTFLGHVNATLLERTSGYGPVVIGSHDIRAGEVVIVTSNSGVNPVPIEAAIAAKERGARTVSITSYAHYADAPSRMANGKRLGDVTDVTIDTRVPRGDALVTLKGLATPVGGASTVVGVSIINAVIVEAAALMLEMGVQPPVIPSMNVPGGDAQMEALVKKYGNRLPLLQNA